MNPCLSRRALSLRFINTCARASPWRSLRGGGGFALRCESVLHPEREELSVSRACVVRELGPELANVTCIALLETFGFRGSSFIRLKNLKWKSDGHVSRAAEGKKKLTGRTPDPKQRTRETDRCGGPSRRTTRG